MTHPALLALHPAIDPVHDNNVNQEPAGSQRPPRKTHEAVTADGSGLRKYQDVMVGSKRLLTTLYYEFCVWLAPVPGALGLVLRKFFWRRLFEHCGEGVVFGVNMILRHPGRISLGNRVVLSDGVVLDARNDRLNKVIAIGDDVMLANNVMVSAKGGKISLGNRTGIGAYTVIQSTNDCPVKIGCDVAIGPHCYIVGGGNYNTERYDIPMWRQGIKDDGGSTIEDDVWLGASVTVLGGVTVKHGSIGASGAVITHSVTSRDIVGGVPAQKIGQR